MKMSEIDRGLVKLLYHAHKRGIIALDLHEVADSMGLIIAEAREVIRSLISEGVLDDLQADGQVCLSAYGIRIAREEEAVHVGERCEDSLPNKEEYSLNKANNAYSRRALILVAIDDAIASWSCVVAKSNLTDDEKGVLVESGNKLFSHPAAVSLWRELLAERLQQLKI